MITSQRQFLAAKDKVKTLKESLILKKKADLPKILIDAHDGQVGELVSEIEAEISEYEALKEMSISDIPIHSIEDLMCAPIRYRIASNMSIEDFARKVEIHSRQIARYETEMYRNATTETLFKILRKLQLNLSGYLKVG